jgi:hypothetical protein
MVVKGPLLVINGVSYDILHWSTLRIEWMKSLS